MHAHWYFSSGKRKNIQILTTQLITLFLLPCAANPFGDDGLALRLVAPFICEKIFCMDMDTSKKEEVDVFIVISRVSNLAIFFSLGIPESIVGIPIWWWRNCMEVASADVARKGLCCCGGFGSIGVVIVAADCVIGSVRGAQLPNKVADGGEMVPGILFPTDCVMLPQTDCWNWCIFFISLSFCVSANFTTSGAEQPSIVWRW